MDNIVILIAAMLCIISIFVIYWLIKKRFEQRITTIETQLASSEFVITELRDLQQNHHQSAYQQQQALKEWQLEHQQVSQQLEHRIKVIKENLSSLEQQFTQLQHQQPQDRLYTRAQKMVALGADIEEIVKECGLPVAEAEILINMHQKK